MQGCLPPSNTLEAAVNLARECFVVMPYGSKPFPDGSGRRYDFEKVWRVLITRAVREAGMAPVLVAATLERTPPAGAATPPGTAAPAL